MAVTLRINLRSPLLWRVIYVVCAVAVCSFILFDVLDLDGSNFPSKPYATQSAVLTSADLDEIEHAHLPKLPEHWNQVVTISLIRQFDLASLRLASESRSSMPASARRHGYRLALPRSSTADPSLPA